MTSKASAWHARGNSSTLASTRSAIGDIASATITLDRTAPILRHIDFTADVTIAQGCRDLGRLFTGSVVRVSATAEELRAECSSSPALHEPMAGGFISTAGALDMIYALLREVGTPDHRMKLQGRVLC